jgi:hypothetical protein
MEKEINSLGSVYVEKSQLLDIVKGNKEKHDVIYEAALIGYNQAVKNYLGRLESESQRIKELTVEYAKQESYGKRFDKTGLYLIDCEPPAIPVEYGYEYDKTIKKLELSTADKISLVDAEFNQYVMNNWSWKQQFLASNTSYALISGCSGFGIGGTDINQLGQLGIVNKAILNF